MKLLLDLIAPHNCLGCFAEGSLVCDDCYDVRFAELESGCFLCSALTVNFAACKKCAQKTKISNLYIATEYGDLARDLIGALKFSNNSDAAKVIAKLIGQRFSDKYKDIGVISYIPTATSRIRRRGYDQSELIAKELAKQLNIRFVKTLVRTDQSRSVGSSKKQRVNSQGYRIINEVKDTNILLVDDVVTTGETFKKAALNFDNSSTITGVAFCKTLLK